MSFSLLNASLKPHPSYSKPLKPFHPQNPFSFHKEVFFGALPYGKIIGFSGAPYLGSTSLAYLFLSELTRSNIKVIYLSPTDFGYLSAYELGMNFNNLIVIDCPKEKLHHVFSILIKGSCIVAINSSCLMAFKNFKTITAKLQAFKTMLIVIDSFDLSIHSNLNTYQHFDYKISAIKNTFITADTLESINQIDAGRILQRRLDFNISGRRAYHPAEFSLILPQIPPAIQNTRFDDFGTFVQHKNIS